VASPALAVGAILWRMNTPEPRPLVPEDIKISPATVPKAAFLTLAGAVRNADPRDLARKMHPHDRRLMAILERAAMTGATTGTGGWAAEVVPTAVSAWLG
jgi:hypothetical protein